MQYQQMKKSSVNTKSILSDINEILGIADSYQAPDRMLQIVLQEDKKERNKIYLSLADYFKNDYSKDWFWEYFQEEHADRHQNKQDFTPPSIASLIHKVLHGGFHKEKTDHTEVTYDPAAGTGQLLIRDWYLTRQNYMPWNYKPSEHLVVCSELSVKTIPFLLFNLSVRGICGLVFHMNTMTGELVNNYILSNPQNSTICFSDVIAMPKLEAPKTEEQIKDLIPTQLKLFE